MGGKSGRLHLLASESEQYYNIRDLDMRLRRPPPSQSLLKINRRLVEGNAC